jgi:hypothetical protein
MIMTILREIKKAKSKREEKDFCTRQEKRMIVVVVTNRGSWTVAR